MTANTYGMAPGEYARALARARNRGLPLAQYLALEAIREDQRKRRHSDLSRQAELSSGRVDGRQRRSHRTGVSERCHVRRCKLAAGHIGRHYLSIGLSDRSWSWHVWTVQSKVTGTSGDSDPYGSLRLAQGFTVWTSTDVHERRVQRRRSSELQRIAHVWRSLRPKAPKAPNAPRDASKPQTRAWPSVSSKDAQTVSWRVGADLRALQARDFVAAHGWTREDFDAERKRWEALLAEEGFTLAQQQ